MKNPKLTLILLLLGLAVGGGFATAQPKGESSSGTGGDHAMGMHGKMKMMGEHSCPMMEAGSIADVQIENTDKGAVIRLSAKNASDVPRVQHMAQMMSEHMGSAADMSKHEHKSGSQSDAKPSAKPAK